ncbi:hypothetical protein VHN57_15145 [Sphingobium sp. WW5]|uniref:Uncharacterized protein n=1 Tax=Sphingobium yanoikuyae TaxID=13690 RepID=A0A6M4G1C3_SPHYA|nr:hypothetical protein [Sphingobium yanoikuyae]QJR01038.1 hypothetical protein HH800_01795 [Sphingobium yanoikuyae]
MRTAFIGSRSCAKYFMENDNSRNFFTNLLERKAPAIIERRLAKGDPMDEVEDFLMLFCWSGPRAAIQKRRDQ